MKSDVFRERSYKTFLRKELARTGLTMTELAGALGVSVPYLSRVLAGKGELSPEQLFLAAQYLKLEKAESRALGLLAELESARADEYKKELERELEQLRSEHSNLGNQLARSLPHTKMSAQSVSPIEYHLNPNFQIVHMALEVPQFQSDPAALCAPLSVSEDEIFRIIEKLISFKMAKKVGSRYLAESAFLHLKEGDTLSEQNHNNWRIHALRKLSRAPKKSYQYTATVCADKKAFQLFRDGLRELVTEFSKSVRHSASETVFQINVDLFHLL